MSGSCVRACVRAFMLTCCLVPRVSCFVVFFEPCVTCHAIEFARYGNSEIHNTAALVGGIASQEVSPPSKHTHAHAHMLYTRMHIMPMLCSKSSVPVSLSSSWRASADPGTQSGDEAVCRDQQHGDHQRRPRLGVDLQHVIQPFPAGSCTCPRTAAAS